MGNDKKSPADKPQLDDSTKLTIREEVESRLESPPASFARLIEDEVERRINQRVGHYRLLGVVVLTLFGTFAVILWNVSLSTVRSTVAEKLSEEPIIAAKERITAIQTNAEAMNRDLTMIYASATTNQSKFLERLNQIKKQDEVVLISDLPKLIVTQIVTNLTDDHTITLDYEAIPGTVKVWRGLGSLDRFVERIDGRSVVFTNDNRTQRVLQSSITSSPPIRIEFIRKSLH